MLSITNLDLGGLFFFLVLIMLWFVALTGILCDFANYITRRPGINKICKHIFEAMTLLPTIVAGWSWANDRGAVYPTSRQAGHIIILLSLACYFYSVYRKSIAALGIEIVVNCFLLAGWACTIFFSIRLANFGVWVFMGLPVNILFVQALLENYKKLRIHRQRADLSTALPNRE